MGDIREEHWRDVDGESCDQKEFFALRLEVCIK